MKTLNEIIPLIYTLPESIRIVIIDLFCGAGGVSWGVEQATIDGEKVAKVLICVNHDENAILSHNANLPDTLHLTEDIRTVAMDPFIQIVSLVRKHRPDIKILLHASLECTQFSKAKGGQSRDADSRTLAEHLFRYFEAINPDYISIENVEEFMSWGDVDENGKPISMDRGRLYQRWVRNVKKYGYDFDHRILNSADFGAFTSRKRFFGQFAKYGLPIAWPEPTHSKNGEIGLFGKLKKWNPVREVLDLNDEGNSVFTRKKALTEKTLERIYAGLIKFVAGGKDKWLIKYNSTNGKTGKHVPPSIDEPCPTISCQGRLGVAKVNFLSKYYSGHPDSKNISIDGPAHAVKTKDNHSLITSEFIAAYYGNGDNCSSVESPAPTVTTKDRLSCVKPVFLCSYNFKDAGKDVDLPSPVILTKDRLALVSPCFIDQQFGQSKPAGIENPLGSITTNPKYALVKCQPWLMNTNFGNTGSSLSDPAPVITANRKWHYLMNPQWFGSGSDINKPCFTLIARMDKAPAYLVVTESGEAAIEVYESDSHMTRKIKEFMAMYGIVDIKMRMLKIPELKQIMGFPEKYTLIGTQADQKKFIGNAVEVNMARALCAALASKLREFTEVKMAI
jgi:DNA (cytosine-5)-methyltransferase 1